MFVLTANALSAVSTYWIISAYYLEIGGICLKNNNYFIAYREMWYIATVRLGRLNRKPRYLLRGTTLPLDPPLLVSNCRVRGARRHRQLQNAVLRLFLEKRSKDVSKPQRGKTSHGGRNTLMILRDMTFKSFECCFEHNIEVTWLSFSENMTSRILFLKSESDQRKAILNSNSDAAKIESSLPASRNSLGITEKN